MLIPMSASVAMGWIMPAVFALATALPVILVAWILAFSAGKIGDVYGKIKVVQRWLNLIVGILFLVIGIYYCLMVYL
jgi:cytochrome c biogenesis protein CcdA